MSTTKRQLQTLKKFYFEDQYRREMRDLLRNGVLSDNRTLTPTLTRSAPAHFEIDLGREGIPALRGKKVFVKKAVAEAFWIMRGDMNIRYLHAHDVRYWDIFADYNGNIGRSYGHRFRNLNQEDQFTKVLNALRATPNSRREVISFWDPSKDTMVTPCFLSFHFLIHNGKLDMHITQRSGDIFLGVPTDAVMFSIIMGVAATYLEVPLGKMYYTVNALHLYENHIPQAKKYLSVGANWFELHSKTPIPATPTKLLNWRTTPSSTIDNLIGNIETMGLNVAYQRLREYRSMPYIKADISK